MWFATPSVFNPQIRRSLILDDERNEVIWREHVKKMPDGLRKELEYRDLYLAGEETEGTKDAVSGLPSDASYGVGRIGY
jgi:predicted oxidoreductase (fatty acid repression mutant protein)